MKPQISTSFALWPKDISQISSIPSKNCDRSHPNRYTRRESMGMGDLWDTSGRIDRLVTFWWEKSVININKAKPNWKLGFPFTNCTNKRSHHGRLKKTEPIQENMFYTQTFDNLFSPIPRLVNKYLVEKNLRTCSST